MRRTLLFPALVLATACGGPSTQPGGNPPPPSGQAASLAVQAGDGQQADPGTAVAILPAVLVKNAAGQPVAGATVQFTIVDGGGSVSGATATANSQGIAAVGGWVLGESVSQTLEAQLGSLTPVRFHATVTPLSEATIGPGGGTLEITTAGNPYDGLRLTIPPGAFPNPGIWRMGLSAAAPTLNLPAGFSVAGPALRIETNQGRADHLMTLRIPVQRVAGTVPLFVMFDPARNRMEMVPIVASDATSITVAGSHLNPTMVLGPTPAAAPRPSQQRFAAQSLGTGLGIPINATLTSLGSPLVLAAIAQIEWGVPDLGSYLFPGGHGPAVPLMTILSALSNQPVGPAIKTSWPGGPLADTAALAGLMIMAKRHFGGPPGASQVLADLAAFWAALAPTGRDSLTAMNLRGMLMTSNAPQLMMFTEQLTGAPPGRVARAVFATMYGTANSTLWFSGPADPLAASTLTLGPTGFLSKLAREVQDATPFAAQAVLPLGGSFLYPIDQFADVLPTMMNVLNASGPARDAGNRLMATLASFLDVTLEFQPTAGAPWRAVDSTLEIRDTTAAIRALCHNCANAIPQSSPPEQQTLTVSTGGLGFLGGGRLGFSGSGIGGIFNALGVGHVNGAVLASIQPTIAGLAGGLLERILTPVQIPAIQRIFTIQPDSQTTTVSTPLVVHAPVVNPPQGLGYEIQWVWGDGTTTVVQHADSATHGYQTTGTYAVQATLRYPAAGPFSPVLMAVARGTVIVDPPVFVWTFRSTTLQSSTLPPGGIGPEPEDTTISNIVSGIMTNLQANPTNNSLAVLGIANGGPTCQAGAVLQRFPAGQPAASFDSTATFGLVGSCGDPDFAGNLTMGPLGNGTIVGSAAPVPNPDVITLPGGSVNAQMTGRNLTGTFVWNVRCSTGIGTYTVTFQATQAKP